MKSKLNYESTFYRGQYTLLFVYSLTILIGKNANSTYDSTDKCISYVYDFV